MERKTFLQFPLLVPLAALFEEQKKKKKPATTAGTAPRQCSTCFHYSAVTPVPPAPASGWCQRYPKTTSSDGKTSSFPMMFATDICGEYAWEAQ